jgi:hypothetical protein
MRPTLYFCCATWLLFILPQVCVDGYVYAFICNHSGRTVQVRNMFCCSFSGMSIGDTLEPSSCVKYTAPVCGRVFVRYSDNSSTVQYTLGATSPIFSSNSATGFGLGGLQPYNEWGEHLHVRWNLGEGDRADWSHPNTYTGDFPNPDYCGEACYCGG